MYATLEEAFGVSSFAPTQAQTINVPTGTGPLALRGDVGAVAKRNDERMNMRTPREPVARPPVRRHRKCDVVKAHARGGAAAAWRVIPRGVRADMVRFLDTSTEPDVDVAAVMVVAVAVLILIM